MKNQFQQKVGVPRGDATMTLEYRLHPNCNDPLCLPSMIQFRLSPACFSRIAVFLGLTVVVPATCTTLGQSTGAGERTPPGVKRGTAERAVKSPSTLYVRDNDGSLVPVPNVKQEEVRRLRQGDDKEAAKTPQALYAIERLDISGQVSKMRADLLCELELKTMKDGPIAIPLGLSAAILESTSFLDGEHRSAVTVEEENHNLACIVDGEPRKVRLQLSLWVPLTERDGRSVLKLDPPSGAVSHCRLSIDGRAFDPRVSPPAVVSGMRTRADDVELDFERLRGEFELSWSPHSATADTGVQPSDFQSLPRQSLVRVNAFARRTMDEPRSGAELKIVTEMQWEIKHQPATFIRVGTAGARSHAAEAGAANGTAAVPVITPIWKLDGSLMEAAPAEASPQQLDGPIELSRSVWSLRLPTPRIGTVHLEAEYSVPLATASGDAAQFTEVPLLIPVADSLLEYRWTAEHDNDWQMEVKSPGWQGVGPEERFWPSFQCVALDEIGLAPLHVAWHRRNEFDTRTFLVDRLLYQIWMSPHHRHDRAVYRLETTESSIRLQLPKTSIVENVCVLVDGQPSASLMRGPYEMDVVLSTSQPRKTPVSTTIEVFVPHNARPRIGRCELELATIVNADWAREVTYFVCLPREEQILLGSAAAERWLPADRWNRETGVNNAGSTDGHRRRLETWIGAQVPMESPDRTRDYVATGFGPYSRVSLYTASWFFLVGSFATGVVGVVLACVQVPELRRPMALAALTLTVLVLWITPVGLPLAAAQGLLLGLLLSTLAVSLKFVVATWSAGAAVKSQPRMTGVMGPIPENDFSWGSKRELPAIAQPRES